MKNTNTSTENNGKFEMVQWGKKQIVTRTIASIDELKESGLVEKYASNFGYNHLIKSEFSRMENNTCEYKNFFIVKADPKFNYGLDFKIFALYVADKGINFLKEFRLGSASMTSAPLERVNLNHKMPVGYIETFSMDHEEIKNWNDEQKADFKNKVLVFNENLKNNIIESFEFATNVWYKKDQKHRPELRELCKDYGFIFA